MLWVERCRRKLKWNEGRVAWSWFLWVQITWQCPINESFDRLLREFRIRSWRYSRCLLCTSRSFDVDSRNSSRLLFDPFRVLSQSESSSRCFIFIFIHSHKQTIKLYNVFIFVYLLLFLLGNNRSEFRVRNSNCSRTKEWIIDFEKREVNIMCDEMPIEVVEKNELIRWTQDERVVVIEVIHFSVSVRSCCCRLQFLVLEKVLRMIVNRD